MAKGLGDSSAEQTPFLLSAPHADRKADQTHTNNKKTFQAITGIVSTLGDNQEVHRHARSSPKLTYLTQ